MDYIELMIESGAPFQEIIKYLEKIATCHEGRTYYGAGWKVELYGQKWVRKGSLTLPRTKLLFCGNETVVKAIVKEYRMRFLSAGG